MKHGDPGTFLPPHAPEAAVDGTTPNDARTTPRPDLLIAQPMPGVLAVHKASGELVHNSKFAGRPERTLTDRVRDAHGAGYAPVHRLDRGTSGVLLFGAGAAACQAAQAVLDAPGTTKLYTAVVRGHVHAHAEGTLVDHPVRTPGKPKDAPRPEARSHVWCLAQSAASRVSLVAVALYTGRTHQARLHLKHLSHPIIGDANYGKGKLNRAMATTYGLDRLALHAHVLHTPGWQVWAPWPPALRAALSQLFTPTALADAQAKLAGLAERAQPPPGT